VAASGRLGGPVGDVVAQWLAHQAVAFRFRVHVWHLSSLRLTDISMWLSPGMVLGHRACGEPAISLHSHHVSLVRWTTRLFPSMRDPGSIPRGYISGTGILLLALSRYIVDPT
jgi:hypothetical protein